MQPSRTIKIMESGISISDLAKKIGRDKKFVSKTFLEAENLDKYAIVVAVVVVVVVVWYRHQAPTNHYNNQAPTPYTQRLTTGNCLRRLRSNM